MAEMQITCFTDIEGFTTQTEEKGHAFVLPLVDEFLRVGEVLISTNGGELIKPLGDSHMATFEQLECALRFATEFQQYYLDQPCLRREVLPVRVSLHLGVVERKNGDVFGSGVNQAARLEEVTPGGRVFLNLKLRDAIVKVWGPDACTAYFESVGKYKFKGVPKKQEVWEFRWSAFGKDKPDHALAARVYHCLESAQMDPTNLSYGDLAQPGLAIWPAVPRQVATSIHRAQIEILRLLAFLGWRITLLVADCGSGFKVARKHAESFAEAVLGHAGYRGLEQLEFTYLSDFFQPDHRNHADIVESLREMTDGVKVEDLFAMHEKEYTETIKKQLGGDSTLDFLRPVLTGAGVRQVVRDFQKMRGDSKAILVSGIDERMQWSRLLADSYSAHLIGAVHHPTFSISEGGKSHTARQTDEWPIWHSRKELEDDMATTNAAKWVFQLLGQLPAFPADSVMMPSGPLRAADWAEDEWQLPSQADKGQIIDLVWDKLNPARS